jgi:hypothetical protein
MRIAMLPEEFEEHERTYRAFVKGVFLVAVVTLLALVILGWTFSDGFGRPKGVYGQNDVGLLSLTLIPTTAAENVAYVADALFRAQIRQHRKPSYDIESQATIPR